MNRIRAAVLLGILFAGQAWADAPVLALLDMAADGVESRLEPSCDQVSVTRSQEPAGLLIQIHPGAAGYPGVALKPEGAETWDLSAYGHIEARVVNTGEKGQSFALRVDNAGDWRKEPWNTEQTYLKPGATGTVTVIFGYAYGRKPGYPLNPSAVSSLTLFASKSDAVQLFRLEALAAAGPAGEKPPVDPNTLRFVPPGGVLFGAGASTDAVLQVVGRAGASATLSTEGAPALQVGLPGKGDPSALLKLAAGRWDLRACLEARVKLRNAGETPVTPSVRLESNGGPTDLITAQAPLLPGTSMELVVPFASASIWQGEKGSGSRFANDAASGVVIAATAATNERLLVVEAITVGMPPAPALPDWLGKRPPVEGEWVQTLAEEFDGSAVDPARWNLEGENYYDKKSHWSKENVLVGGGVARLRYEKKWGHHNDDTNRPASAYAAGYLNSYNKWTQRYGYFESRMKLPSAPGLWPAFWMMPDRGGTNIWWYRQDTKFGGMEFDIMEHLTRWGPNRYNIAMHWDGYQKDHKATGSDRVFVQPDKDGFITTGLLWTPGELVYYANGNVVARWKNERVCTVPMYLLYTLPCGGWDNNAVDDAQLPADFVIDYVRAWQRQDLAAANAAQEAGGTRPE